MKKLIILSLLMLAIIVACNTKDPIEEPATYDATPYTLDIGNFPTPDLPIDNILTKTGVELGRMLFYEPMLSKDGSQACADCHAQKDAFSDIRQFSVGVEGLPGKRQAMVVMNLAWHNNGFFWDGRAPKLRDQALKPIQDPLEMNEKLSNVITKLSNSKKYTDQFIRAFGDDSISSERISLALEQFMFSVISNNSKYDQWQKGTATLSESEERGRKLFFTEYDPSGINRGAECFHCHANANFTNDEYMNNGLTLEANIIDEGRKKVTNDPTDKGKFKVPSLRNIANTAPYMHDGRIATLEQVIEHYDHGVKQSSTVDPLLQYNLQPNGLGLTPQEKADLVAFLKTLTDNSFMTNPAFAKPN